MSRDKITTRRPRPSPNVIAEQSKVAREKLSGCSKEACAPWELLNFLHRAGQDRVSENTILREGWSSWCWSWFSGHAIMGQKWPHWPLICQLLAGSANACDDRHMCLTRTLCSFFSCGFFLWAFIGSFQGCWMTLKSILKLGVAPPEASFLALPCVSLEDAHPPCNRHPTLLSVSAVKCWSFKGHGY